MPLRHRGVGPRTKTAARRTGSPVTSSHVASMTGAGQATVEHPAGRFTVEVRSVNHRFLKTSLRTPLALSSVEPEIEARVKKVAERGHVSLNVRFKPSAKGATIAIDDEGFAAGAARLRALAEAPGLREPVLSDVLRLPGVSEDALDAADDALKAAALEGVDQALVGLVAARRTEGAMLVAEMLTIFERVTFHVHDVQGCAAQVPERVRDRLHARLADLLRGSGVAPDPEQVAREVALAADRADVQEELTRLRAHVAHAREMLEKGGPLGRRLDFLVQEMHREANTIGSKTAELDVTRHVVELKADLERLRQQVQNLE